MTAHTGGPGFPPAGGASPLPPPPARTREQVPVLNASPLIPFVFPWQLRPQTQSLIVAVKATLDIVPGEVARLAEEQLLPCGDVRYDDHPQASLRYASDFVIRKPLADIILVGHAYPADNPAVGVVTLQVGALRKSIAVFGDRSWGALGAQSSPAPFKQMPLRWEHALGGPLSQANPVGRGFKTGVILPNLERPEALVKSTRDTPAPACFAPVAPEWRQRMSKLGSFGAAWLRDRWPYYPEDFDYQYFNAAAPELQVPYLRGDETFAVQGARPQRKAMEGRLPGIAPRVFAHMSDPAVTDLAEVALNLDTLWIDAEAMKIVLVWRGVCMVRDDEASDIAMLFVTMTEPGQPLDARRARELYRQAGEEADVFKDAEPVGQAPSAPLPVAAPPPAPPAPSSTGPAWLPKKAPAPIAPAGPAWLPQAPPTAQVKRRAAPLLKRPAPRPLPAPVVSRDQVLAWIRDKVPLAGRDLTGADLSRCDLAGANLKGTIFAGAKLLGAKLDGANLTEAVLSDADATGASFADAQLVDSDFDSARLEGATFVRAILDGANFAWVHAKGAVFAGVHAERAVFAGADLSNAKLERSELTASDFSSATLDDATFSAARLDNARFYDCAGKSCKFDAASMKSARMDDCRLSAALLSSVQAAESVWERAELNACVFLKADVQRADFTKAQLQGSVLNEADGRGASFRKAMLQDARMLKANLMQASFESANLRQADLRGANLFQAETWRADLHGAQLEMAFVAGSKLAKKR